MSPSWTTYSFPVNCISPSPLVGEGWDEGAKNLPLLRLIQDSQNLLKNGFGFFQHLVIPKSNDSITL